jgi:hypothetical protein
MDASHIVVGGLTALAFASLVWIEIRSRRNNATQAEEQSVPLAVDDGQPSPKKRRPARR